MRYVEAEPAELSLAGVVSPTRAISEVQPTDDENATHAWQLAVRIARMVGRSQLLPGCLLAEGRGERGQQPFKVVSQWHRCGRISCCIYNPRARARAGLPQPATFKAVLRDGQVRDTEQALRL